MPKGLKGFQKGHKRLYSDEVKAKMKGRKGYWLGKKRDETTILKMSLSRIGKHSSPNTEWVKTGFNGIETLGINGYRNLHKWLVKNIGKPTKCEHCGKDGLTGKQIHWANKDHTYKRNLTDYIRLCAKCHWYYDRS